MDLPAAAHHSRPAKQARRGGQGSGVEPMPAVLFSRPRFSWSRAARWLPALAITVGILDFPGGAAQAVGEAAQASLPYPIGCDAGLHFLLYLVLASAMAYALWPNSRAGRGLGLVWLLTVAYGAFDEWHQLYIAGRTASVRDWGWDAAGALAACLVWGVAYALFRRTPGPPCVSAHEGDRMWAGAEPMRREVVAASSTQGIRRR